jgi:hypothetical protein
VQLTALRKGWTHTSLYDEKGILQTVEEDQMIDCGCTSHSNSQPGREMVLKVLSEIMNKRIWFNDIEKPIWLVPMSVIDEKIENLNSKTEGVLE